MKDRNNVDFSTVDYDCYRWHRSSWYHPVLWYVILFVMIFSYLPLHFRKRELNKAILLSAVLAIPSLITASFSSWRQSHTPKEEKTCKSDFSGQKFKLFIRFFFKSTNIYIPYYFDGDQFLQANHDYFNNFVEFTLQEVLYQYIYISITSAPHRF